MKLKRFNLILSILFTIMSIVLCIATKEIKYLSFIPFIILPYVLKVSPLLNCIYLIYMFLTMFLGAICGWFRLISWYDTFTHFWWGLLSGFLSLYILDKFKLFNEKRMFFNIFFIFMFVAAFSCLWEVFEFTIDNIFTMNIQKVETGVTDTMKDVIIALLGNIIFLMGFIYEYTYKHKLLIRRSQERF